MVYLGSKITSDGKSIREIKQRIVLEKRAFTEKQVHFKKDTSQYQDSLKHMYGGLRHTDVKHGS